MILPLSTELNEKIQYKIDAKTKPIGALGVLEDLAKQIARIQNTLQPTLNIPTMLVFAGDHGIAATQKVSPYPQEVTQQMVLNFISGGAAINVFCNQNNIALKVVDAGVNAKFEACDVLIDAKVAKGTKSYDKEPAMTNEQFEIALTKGKEIVQKLYKEGCNTIGFGEMGISNTSSAALLMSYFLQIPIEECVGKGTGLDDEGVIQKAKVLKEVQELHNLKVTSAATALAAYGGFEIVMICGAMLEAARLQMTLLIDGFIVTAALLAAHAIDKNILDYCIFSHTSGEQGHEKMLNFLKARPLLNLGLRLGEGSGAAVAFPIIKSAVSFFNEMATFESAQVSESNS